MANNNYLEMMKIFNLAHKNNKKVIMCWGAYSQFKIRCSCGKSYETGLTIEDGKKFKGEYVAEINEIEVLSESTYSYLENQMNRNNLSMEINIYTRPKKIIMDNTTAWEENKRHCYDGQDYMEMLLAIDNMRTIKKPLIINWKNNLKVKCTSSLGIEEGGYSPEDEEYEGDFYIILQQLEILENGLDDSVKVYEGFLEVNLLTIPEKIMLEDGTVLWENK